MNYRALGRPVRDAARALRMMPATMGLRRQSAEQRLRYAALCRTFETKYEKLKASHTDEFAVPYWRETNSKLERDFLPCPPFRFLRHPTIRWTMFFDARGQALRLQLDHLRRSEWRTRLVEWLKEDPVGDPLLCDAAFMTSHNTVHHLYHLRLFSDRTGVDLARAERVVEWGGGYGNVAKLMRRIAQGSLTYTIIDTPMFACLQWLYLSAVLGEEHVHLLEDAGDAPMDGRINLLPVSFASTCPIDADVFISTWALSESSGSAQDLVVGRRWFGARHLLLAFQDSSELIPEGSRIGRLAVEDGAAAEPIGFLAGNYYAFR